MSSSKKVLMFTPVSCWGGGVIEYINSLKVYLGNSIDFENFYIGRRKGSSSSTYSSLLITFSDAIRLTKNLYKERYDVVHINPSLNKKSMLRDGIFLLILRFMRVKKSLVFIHGWNNKDVKNLHANHLKRFLFKQTFGSATLISVLANEFKRDLVRLGINGNKIIVSTTMYDNTILNNEDDTKTEDGLRIAFMSRFIKEKGIFELLEAFKLVLEVKNNAELVLAGDGPIRKEVEAWIQKNKLGSHIKVTGYLRGNDKAHLLNSSNLFILPTYHGEGCPVAILEAMAAGLPVISTSVGAIPDLLNDNEQILQTVSAIDIKMHILRITNDASNLKMIGAKNKEKAIRNYSTPIVGGRMMTIYENLSNNKYTYDIQA